MSFNKFEFKLNNVLIKTPSSFRIEYQPITKGGRLLSGKMKLQGVALKHVVVLRYDLITVEELNKIISLTMSEFDKTKVITQKITFPYYNDEPKTIDTYFAPMEIERDSVSTSKKMWKNFELKFIEL